MTISISAAALIAFLLVFARALGWLVVVVPFSNRAVIPTMVTVGLGAAMAMMIAPSLDHRALPLTTPALLGALALQIVTGLAIGFVVQLLVSAASAAGTLLDAMGVLNLQGSLNPLGITQGRLLGQYYQQAVILILLVTGGYTFMVRGFAQSFAGPGFSLAATRSIGTTVVTDLGLFFVSALEIAAPIMVVLFGIQIALALIAKAAPQTNVWFLGMPVQILVTLALVAVVIAALPNDVANLLARGLGEAAHLFGRP